VRKNSDITPGHVSPTLLTMLMERGAFRDEDLQKYSTPSWLVWLKNTFGID
jgi:transketolase N-terminal domain/subunit